MDIRRKTLTRRFRTFRKQGARRRRGLPGRSPGMGRGIRGLPPELSRWVWNFASRAQAYPWVWACSVCSEESEITVYLQVPRPMTRAMAHLARRWAHEMGCPAGGCSPRVEVGDAPPDEGRHHVMFWRPPACDPLRRQRGA